MFVRLARLQKPGNFTKSKIIMFKMSFTGDRKTGKKHLHNGCTTK